MLNAFSYIFFGLFLLTSIFHLLVAFNENEKLRHYSKPFCLLLLALAVVVTVPSHPLIYVGATLGMIGDLFLIKNKENKYFITGALAFLVGHFFYIVALLSIYPLSPLLLIIIVVALLIIIAVSYPLSRKICKSKIIALIGNIYLATLLLVTTLATLIYIFGDLPYMLLAIFGGICFLVSDLILTQATFVKDFKRRDFYIMFTYLLGQIFIVLGLVLTVIYL
jgi:uncharacterized membrane protein YhhN